MIVRNNTNDPVEYEQNGTPPEEEADALAAEVVKGSLAPFQQNEFAAKGIPPYHVAFWSPKEKPTKRAEVGDIPVDDLEVVLTGFPRLQGI